MQGERNWVLTVIKVVVFTRERGLAEGAVADELLLERGEPLRDEGNCSTPRGDIMSLGEAETELVIGVLVRANGGGFGGAQGENEGCRAKP